MLMMWISFLIHISPTTQNSNMTTEKNIYLPSNLWKNQTGETSENTAWHKPSPQRNNDSNSRDKN